MLYKTNEVSIYLLKKIVENFRLKHLKTKQKKVKLN